MRYEWQKNIQKLDTLVTQIEDFFEKKNFDVRTLLPTSEGKNIKILAIPTPRTEIGEKMVIEVSKTPKGVAIELSTSEKNENTTKLGLITQMLMGGPLIRKGARATEQVDPIENELLAYIQELISSLQS